MHIRVNWVHSRSSSVAFADSSLDPNAAQERLLKGKLLDQEKYQAKEFPDFPQQRNSQNLLAN